MEAVVAAASSPIFTLPATFDLGMMKLGARNIKRFPVLNSAFIEKQMISCRVAADCPGDLSVTFPRGEEALARHDLIIQFAFTNDRPIRLDASVHFIDQDGGQYTVKVIGVVSPRNFQQSLSARPTVTPDVASFYALYEKKSAAICPGMVMNIKATAHKHVIRNLCWVISGPDEYGNCQVEIKACFVVKVHQSDLSIRYDEARAKYKFKKLWRGDIVRAVKAISSPGYVANESLVLDRNEWLQVCAIIKTERAPENPFVWLAVVAEYKFSPKVEDGWDRLNFPAIIKNLQEKLPTKCKHLIPFLAHAALPAGASDQAPTILKEICAPAKQGTALECRKDPTPPVVEDKVVGRGAQIAPAIQIVLEEGEICICDGVVADVPFLLAAPASANGASVQSLQGGAAAIAFEEDGEDVLEPDAKRQRKAGTKKAQFKGMEKGGASGVTD